MNADQIIEDAVREHNRTAPGIIIQRCQLGSLTLYFLYLQDINVWDSKQCSLFLNLKQKLGEERICPFIGLNEINGENKIGIFIAVRSEL